MVFVYRFLSLVVLRILKKIVAGELLLTLPNGKSHKFGKSIRQKSIKADIKIHNWRVFANLILRGDIGFGEDYIHGNWDTSDLNSLMRLAIENSKNLSTLINGKKLLLLDKISKHRENGNTINKARDNIKRHYDLGNEFYSLWLDESLTYSSAIFGNCQQAKEKTLVKAQQFKIDRALDFFSSKKANATICEIGFGWGSLAKRLHEQTNYNYHGITLSAKQYEYVINRAWKVKKNSRLNFELKDYRLLRKKYDGIISIEMFEAVGEEYWDEFFSTISRCLKNKSKAVIQTILIKDKKFEAYRKGVDFIQTYIFPGGMLPTKKIFKELANRHQLIIEDEFYFANDYAQTLKIWNTRFENCEEKLAKLGFSPEFKRMWKFYLNYCRSGFESGDIDVGQYVLEKR